MRKTTQVSLSLALLSSVSSAQADPVPFSVAFTQRGFERIAHRRGTSVYKHRTSEIIKLGAEGRFGYRPEQVMRVILDYRRQLGTIDRLSEARVLKRGRNWLLVYQRLNLPVIDDRDFILRVTWGKKPNGTHWIKYRTARRGGPAPRKGVVRVTDHHGSWLIRPSRDGRASFVRFQVSIDMAGMLPRWLAKSGAGKEVPNLFLSFNTLLLQQYLRGHG